MYGTGALVLHVIWYCIRTWGWCIIVRKIWVYRLIGIQGMWIKGWSAWRRMVVALVVDRLHEWSGWRVHASNWELGTKDWIRCLETTQRGGRTFIDRNVLAMKATVESIIYIRNMHMMSFWSLFGNERNIGFLLASKPSQIISSNLVSWLLVLSASRRHRHFSRHEQRVTSEWNVVCWLNLVPWLEFEFKM